MKYINWTFCVCTSLSLIFVLLVSSVELALYSNKNYFEREYVKYQVAETVDMNISDLLVVTDEMMKYLRDKREDLNIYTTVSGQVREFFNEREKAHMKDVKDLFVKAEFLRTVLGIFVFVSFIIFLLRKQKNILFRSFVWTSGVFLSVSVTVGIIVSTNFYKYFTIFHELFFDNDLWILDPRTDLLINIVPEPFFMDTALRIGIIFLMLVFCIAFLCSVFLRRKRSV